MVVFFAVNILIKEPIDPSEVAAEDLPASTGDGTLEGFYGGFTSSGYGYLVPYRNGAWHGKVVRFGVDSAPVVAMINTGTSQDGDLMRLLRQMADCTFLHDFSYMAVHVTRSRNTLADQGTRFATPQDFNAYLGAEGYSRLDAGATPLTCPEGHSQLQCDGISRLRLGPRSRRTRRLRLSATLHE